MSKKIGRGSFLQIAISLGRLVVPFPQIVINLPRIFDKLHCLGESYRFSGWEDPLLQTHTDKKDILLLLLKELAAAPQVSRASIFKGVKKIA